MTSLVVTDNLFYGETCRKCIKSLDAHPMVWAKSGKEGLEIIDSGDINVVFLDLDINDIPSDEWIKKATHISSSYIIGIVGVYTKTQVKISALKAGACDLADADFLDVSIQATFTRAKRRGALVAMLQMETEKILKDNMHTILDSFKSFVHIRKQSPSNPTITDKDVLNYFPNADYSQITPEMIINAVYSGQLNQLIPSTPQKILCVEDEPDLHDIFHHTFMDSDVVSALTAEEALQLAKTHDFDTAIVDIGLPGMTGDQLIGELKTHNPKMEIIALSAYQDSQLIVRCFKRGASDYIVKPFENDELQKKITLAFETKMIHFVLNSTIKSMNRIYKFEEYPGHELD
jgi:DNA-binding response OmpR family regulator